MLDQKSWRMAQGTRRMAKNILSNALRRIPVQIPIAPVLHYSNTPLT